MRTVERLDIEFCLWKAFVLVRRSRIVCMINKVLREIYLISGYRHISLRNELNQPLGIATLFVYIRAGDYVPDALAGRIFFLNDGLRVILFLKLCRICGCHWESHCLSVKVGEACSAVGCTRRGRWTQWGGLHILQFCDPDMNLIHSWLKSCNYFA